MTARRPLVLDLDGTLLHLEPTPGAIVVPGRTRAAYVADTTIAALAALSAGHELVVATGRSWAGTRPVVEGLAAHGVDVSGVVVEDGARVGPPGHQRPLGPEPSWPALRAALHCRTDWPLFEGQLDFESCLVARAPTPALAATLAPRLFEAARRAASGGGAEVGGLRWFRDGRKVYVLAAHADKWAGLQALLGDRAREAAGVGDGANDVCWLVRVALPCTLAGAVDAALDAVRSAGGFVATAPGHAGIADVLTRLAVSPSCR